MERIEALAKFLECGVDELNVSKWDDCLIEFHSEEYLVLTDEEADERAKEYITNSLWAFNADFLSSYINVDAEDILSIQDKMCEGCNDMFGRLIGDKLNDFVEDAISADGRGHFLSQYDFEENEQDEYFIYRVN